MIRIPDEPLITVILPVRNGERTINAAAGSILGQSQANFEMILIDDGSTDDTPRLLNELQARDPKVRTRRQPFQGLVSALQNGIAEARGRFIARMDADDIALPGRLQAQLAHLERHPAVGLVSCRVRYGGNPRKQKGYADYVRWTNRLLSGDDISLNRFVESPLAHPSVMFRKELVEKFGGYRQGDFPEDYELWLRWMDAGVRMEKLPDALLVWNDPPQRLSRTDPRYSVENFYRIKSHYLFRWLKVNNPHFPCVWLIGAGRTARRRAAFLERLGVRIEAFLDVDPRKVGRPITGRPVLHRENLPAPGSQFLLSYVGSRGARLEIEGFLQTRGFQRGRDFLMAA
jgi:glycosyltransferase involved in cell wall biosynthesis